MVLLKESLVCGQRLQTQLSDTDIFSIGLQPEIQLYLVYMHMLYLLELNQDMSNVGGLEHKATMELFHTNANQTESC